MATAPRPANLPKDNLNSTQRRSGVNRLARAIVETARQDRRGFSVVDGRRFGFTEPEMTRWFDDAMAEARRIEPKIDGMTVQS